MPEIGEIRIGKNYQKQVWHACEQCGKERWVAIKRGEPRSKACINGSRGTVAIRLMNGVGVVPANDHDCWLWSGATDIRGRGRIVAGGKIKLASRVAYEVFTGEIPPSMNVCHTCDNPLCVNPFHLFLGTQLDNIEDRELKNRGSAKHQQRGYHGRFICQV